jgi:hypothetical protein
MARVRGPYFFRAAFLTGVGAERREPADFAICARSASVKTIPASFSASAIVLAEIVLDG